MPESSTIAVEVLFALPDRQWLKRLVVAAGCSVADAIAASGISAHFGDLVASDANVGVFSRPVTLRTILREGDRVEIYRPLTRDPKDTRRLRARKQKKK